MHPSITVAVLSLMGMEVLAVLSLLGMEVLVRSFNAHRLVTVMLHPDKANVHLFLLRKIFFFCLLHPQSSPISSILQTDSVVPAVGVFCEALCRTD